MKRSPVVELRILPAVAAAALAMGCGSPANQRQPTTSRYCMDQSKNLVELTKCEEETARHPYRGSSYVPLYGYVYGPHGWRPGMHIGGNSQFSRTPGTLTAPQPSNTVRGGFGSSARPVAS